MGSGVHAPQNKNHKKQHKGHKELRTNSKVSRSPVYFFFLHTFDKNWQMMTSHHYCIAYDVILIANMAFQVLLRRQNNIQRRDRIFRDRTRPLDIYDDQDLIRRSCLGRVYLIWGIFCMTIYNHPQQDHIAYRQLYKFLQRWDTMLQDHFSRL